MTYTRPTKAAFTDIFTEFAGVSDTQFDYWIARAERVITTDFGADQLHATQLLTAHYLTVQGLGTGVESQRSSEFGGANKVKSGSLELGWGDGGSSSGSSIGSTGNRYGDEVLAMIKAVRGGPKVTGTGAFPPLVSYGNS